MDGNAVPTGAVREFAAADCVNAALMSEFVESMPASALSRSQMLCAVRGEDVIGLCLVAGNLVPLGLTPDAVDLVADRLNRRGRRFSSVVGPAPQVMALWQLLRPHLGPARDVREDQPSMVIDTDPQVQVDPAVRPATAADMDILLPACVAMFTEEVGYSPLTGGGGYERRIRSLVDDGRSLVRIDETDRGREVVFKAEIGTVGLGVAQVQGVWVHPRHRGQGISVPGIAAVVRYTRANLAPSVSLYVNQYNTAALAAYRRVGFRQVGTYATVLL